MLFKGVKYPVSLLGSSIKSYYTLQRRVYAVNKDDLVYILDDKNIKGSFPTRRAFLYSKTKYRKKKGYEYTPLLKLNKLVYDEDQLLVNIAKKHRYFVDNTGKIFRVAPTTFYPIKYLKVLRMGLDKNRTLLWVEGVAKPFILKRAPTNKSCKLYAGILFIKGKKLLYEVTKAKKKDTVRKL